MPLFKYKAATNAGELVVGEMEAGDHDAVIRRIQAQGQVPIRAEEVFARSVETSRKPLQLLGAKRLSNRDIVVFTMELSILLEAGVTLDKALTILNQMAEHPPLKEMVSRLNADVRRGVYLADAMEAQGNAFSTFYINLVRAGETGGVLEVTLLQLAEFMERSKESRDAVMSSLLYPLILLSMAVLSIIAILTFVVPRFTELFEDAGESLPWLTQVVVTVGGFLEQHFWLVIAVPVAGWYLLSQLKKRPGFVMWRDNFLLGVPLVGSLIGRFETARFTRTLGTLLNSGIPLLQSMAVAKNVVSNKAIGTALDGVQERVKEGQGLAQPVMRTGMFPKLAAHMLQVGEETGNLEAMLLKIADIYDREVRISLQRAITVFEPLLILGLGLLIATIIFSILMAMLGVNDLTLI